MRPCRTRRESGPRQPEYGRLWRHLLLSVAAFGMLFHPVSAQDKARNWTLNGYVKDLQQVWIQDINDPWLTWTTVHNRLDFNYYPGKNTHLSISARNNLNFGELITLLPGLSDLMEHDRGLFDLSWKLADGASYVLSSEIDRAYLEHTWKKLNVRLGRQRVNWGIGLVWNPNDIFNTFSYFDFDYEERPGSDALRLEYYTGMASSAQLAMKLDSARALTLAGMYRFNRWNYDIQIMAGMTPGDLVLGAGWAGQVEGAGFRGEASWFVPRNGQGQVLVASLDADYTLKDGWYFHTGWLYNSAGSTGKAGGGGLLPEADVSVKDLTRSRMLCFAQVAYPITPLIQAGAAGMLNPYDRSSFLGPSLDFSLSENAGIMLFAQVFGGKKGTEFGDYGKIGYIRLRWSF